MGKEKFTDDELELLTEEEREGLLDETVTDDPIEDDEPDEAATDVGAGAPDPKPEEPEPAGAPGEDKPEENGEAAAAPAGAAEAPAEPVAEAGQQPPASVTVPQSGGMPKWQAPENAAERLSEIEREKDDLARKFDDGELTAQEFRAQIKPLDKEERELEQAQFKASISAETTQHQWFNVTVPAFLSAHAEYADGSPLHSALDIEVRRLQAAAAQEGRSNLDPAILEQAHRNVQSGVRKALGLPPLAEKKPDTTTPAQKRNLPPSLNGLPSDDITETEDGGKYAYLDRLAERDPIAYEEALAKLPDAERDAYLAAG